MSSGGGRGPLNCLPETFYPFSHSFLNSCDAQTRNKYLLSLQTLFLRYCQHHHVPPSSEMHLRFLQDIEGWYLTQHFFVSPHSFQLPQPVPSTTTGEGMEESDAQKLDVKEEPLFSTEDGRSLERVEYLSVEGSSCGEVVRLQKKDGGEGVEGALISPEQHSKLQQEELSFKGEEEEVDILD